MKQISLLGGGDSVKSLSIKFAIRSGFGILVGLLVTASPGCAATWAKLGTDSRGVTAFIDRDNLRKDGELRFYSLKYVSAAPGQFAVTYTIMNEMIDCKLRMITTLNLSAYRSDNSLVGTYSKAQPARQIASGSNGADIALAVCNK